MSSLRAVLVFPVRPAAATRVLCGRFAGWLALLPVPLITGAYLVARGCGFPDAAATGGAVLAVELGLACGGAAACFPAGLLVGRRRLVGDLVGPCCVFAAWACVLFPAVLGLAAILGAGAAGALVSALVLLVWGVVAGVGLLGAGDDVDLGRGLVGACTGLTGALLGLLAALLASSEFVVLRRMPVPTDGFGAGDLVLVARDPRPAAGELVFLEDRKDLGGEILAHVEGSGTFLPIGAEATFWEAGSWQPVGRVFFRFDGLGGQSVHPGRRCG